ncbi:MAG: hypothetical protein VYE73_07745 [Acidobacteriota bacterium]|nr:hypothetical protein [Acidobacteriota bacterium]
MNRVLDALVPRQANNDYRGGPISFYGFCLLFAVHVFKSTVHFLKPDSGVNSIASIMVFEGSPDPNNIIYMFSAIGGLTQMMWVMLFALVLWRYRNLIPLMLGFLVVEHLFGFVVGWMHPLTPEYFARTPPGKLAAFPMLLVCSGLLSLALRLTIQSEEAPPGNPA